MMLIYEHVNKSTCPNIAVRADSFWLVTILDKKPDMEKTADALTLSAEMLADCGNFVSVQLNFAEIGVVLFLMQYL